MNKTALAKSTSQQAIWFLIVGAGAALVHFLVLVSMVNLLNITPAWANVGAFLVAFVVSFSGHFHLTFRQPNYSTNLEKLSQEKRVKRESWRSHLPVLGKWFASSVVGFIANQSLFVLGLSWLGEYYYILIWLFVTGIITVMTFALGKLWAFKA